jgi:hypothetical protein
MSNSRLFDPKPPESASSSGRFTFQANPPASAQKNGTDSMRSPPQASAYAELPCRIQSSAAELLSSGPSGKITIAHLGAEPRQWTAAGQPTVRLVTANATRDAQFAPAPGVRRNLPNVAAQTFLGRSQ